MNSAEHNPIMEAGLRRELTAEDLARIRDYVTVHLEESDSWEQDLALNHLLRELPAPQQVGSNFTHLVVQAALSGDTAGIREEVAQSGWRRRFRLWLPRVAVAGCILGGSLLSFQQYRNHTRTELAQNVAKVSHVTTLVSVDVWQDFETIQRLNPMPVTVDEELLAALK